MLALDGGVLGGMLKDQERGVMVVVVVVLVAVELDWEAASHCR